MGACSPLSVYTKALVIIQGRSSVAAPSIVCASSVSDCLSYLFWYIVYRCVSPTAISPSPTGYLVSAAAARMIPARRYRFLLYK